jgi:hypothetical protein
MAAIELRVESGKPNGAACIRPGFANRLASFEAYGFGKVFNPAKFLQKLVETFVGCGFV